MKDYGREREGERKRGLCGEEGRMEDNARDRERGREGKNEEGRDGGRERKRYGGSQSVRKRERGRVQRDIERR